MMKMFDEVQTDEGLAQVVGLLSHNLVEVRLLETVGLRVLSRNDVTEIADTDPITATAKAMEQARQPIMVEPEVARAMNRAAVNPDLIKDRDEGAGLGIVRDDPMFKVKDQPKDSLEVENAKAHHGAGVFTRSAGTVDIPIDANGDPVSPRTGRKLVGIARTRALARLEQGVAGRDE